MKIRGGSGKLQPPNEAILAANEQLGRGTDEFGKFSDDKNEGPPRPRIGDVLSIHLSQEADSAAVWTLTVFVQVAQGEFILGLPIVTNPPSPAAGTGDPPARTVGFAFCPGAIGWKVLATCDDVNEEADLLIQSSQCCGGSAFGVTPNSFIPPELPG
jgi:hypothetical protein